MSLWFGSQATPVLAGLWSVCMTLPCMRSGRTSRKQKLGSMRSAGESRIAPISDHDQDLSRFPNGSSRVPRYPSWGAREPQVAPNSEVITMKKRFANNAPSDYGPSFAAPALWGSDANPGYPLTAEER